MTGCLDKVHMGSCTPVTPKGKMQVNVEMSCLIYMVDTYFKQKYQSTAIIEDRLSHASVTVYLKWLGELELSLNML